MPTNLSLTFDYYTLMILALSKPEFGNKSQEKLIAQVEDAFKMVEDRLAQVYYQYLVTSCFGEARYSGDKSESRIATSASKATDYEPTKALKKLSHLFHDYNWSSSFGGDAWGDIADFALQYGKVPNGFFVDHVVDLEHNCGTVFNKTGDYAKLEMNVYSDTFHRFADSKFSDNLVTDPEQSWFYEKLTRKTAGLVDRWYRVFRHEEPPTCWELAQMDFISDDDDFLIEWGDNELPEPDESRGWQTCPECGGSIECTCSSCAVEICGDWYHRSCAHNNMEQCENCGNWQSDEVGLTKVETRTSYEMWCDACVDDHAHNCPVCGDKIVRCLRTCETGGCRHYEQTTCDNCGTWVDDGSMTTVETSTSYDAEFCDYCVRHAAKVCPGNCGKLISRNMDKCDCESCVVTPEGEVSVERHS